MDRREDDEEPESLVCRELREGRDDLGESMWDEGRDDEVFLGDLVGDLDGDEGSERGWWESSRSSKCEGKVLEEECFLKDGFLLLLPPKNFIWAGVGCRRPQWKVCPVSRNKVMPDRTRWY